MTVSVNPSSLEGLFAPMDSFHGVEFIFKLKSIEISDSDLIYPHVYDVELL